MLASMGWTIRRISCFLAKIRDPVTDAVSCKSFLGRPCKALLDSQALLSDFEGAWGKRSAQAWPATGLRGRASCNVQRQILQVPSQRLQVAFLWYIHRPQKYDMEITLRPMYLLYSHMKPSGLQRPQSL